MIRWNYEPLLIWLPVLALLWLAQKATARLQQRVGVGLWRSLATIGALAALVSYVGLVIGYVLSATHLDHIEPSFVCAAFTAMHGGPLYHAADAPERYSLLYGPAAYLGYGVALRLVWPDFAVCKVVAASASLVALALAGAAAKPVIGARRAMWLAGALAAIWLAHAPKTYWVRADPIIVGSVCWALCAVATWSRTAALVSFVAALAIAVDAKINAAAHFLPLAVILAARVGWRAVGLAMVGGLALAVLPFLLPGVSFGNWLELLRLAGRHGFRQEETRWALQWAALLFALPAAVWVVTRKQSAPNAPPAGKAERALLLAMGLNLALQCVFASKIGSDPTQLVPAAPVCLWASFVWWHRAASGRRPAQRTGARGLSALVGAGILTAASLGAYQGFQIGRATLRQHSISAAIVADLRWIVNVWGAELIVMGCGSNASEFVSSHFVPLVLRGHPYVLDPTAVMEFEKAGRPLPAATIEMIRSGRIRVWLIPKGDTPFSLLNPYPPHRPLFDTGFRRAFETRYRKAAASRFFDVYVWGKS